jgi:hypothetical protein
MKINKNLIVVFIYISFLTSCKAQDIPSLPKQDIKNIEFKDTIDLGLNNFIIELSKQYNLKTPKSQRQFKRVIDDILDNEYKKIKKQIELEKLTIVKNYESIIKLERERTKQLKDSATLVLNSKQLQIDSLKKALSFEIKNKKIDTKTEIKKEKEDTKQSYVIYYTIRILIFLIILILGIKLLRKYKLI